MRKRTATATSDHQAAVAGIDLGSKRSEACLLDEQGAPLERVTLATTAAALERHFAHRPALLIAIETGGQTNWVRRRLEALGHRVLVADARRVKLIWDTHSKDDRRDALFLAQIALRWPNLLHPIRPRSLATDRRRALLTARETLVGARVKLINTARGVLNAFGHKPPPATSEAFARRITPLLPADLADSSHPLLLAIEALSTQIRRYDKQVLALCDGPYRDATAPMRSIRGVGPLTALAFTLELDNDPRRLRDSRSAGALVGLRPKRRDSGERSPQLAITKTGNPMLRKLLVQCAHYILGAFGEDCALKRWGLGLAARTPGSRGKRRAVVATARKLAVLLHTLWRKGETFDPSHGLPSPA